MMPPIESRSLWRASTRSGLASFVESRGIDYAVMRKYIEAGGGPERPSTLTEKRGRAWRAAHYLQLADCCQVSSTGPAASEISRVLRSIESDAVTRGLSLDEAAAELPRPTPEAGLNYLHSYLEAQAGKHAQPPYGASAAAWRAYLARLAFEPDECHRLATKAVETEWDAEREGDAQRGRATAAKLKSLTPWDLMNMPPIRWRVNGWWPARGIAVLYGPPNGGKSFMALHLTLCLARGAPYFNIPTEACSALYIAAEGMAGIPMRLRAAAKAGNFALDDLPIAVVPDAVNLVGTLARGLPVRVGADTERVIATGHFTARRTGLPVGLVVIDTVSRSMTTADENSNTDMAALAVEAQKISDALGCLVLLIHHPGKKEENGMRGGAALLGNVDVVVNLRVGRSIELRHEKLRDGAKSSKLEFRLQQVDLGRDPETGGTTTSAAVEELCSAMSPEDVADNFEDSSAPAHYVAKGKWDQLALETYRRARTEAGGDPLREALPGAYKRSADERGEPQAKEWRRMFNSAVRELVDACVLVRSGLGGKHLAPGTSFPAQ